MFLIINKAYNVPVKMPKIKNKLSVEPDFPFNSLGTLIIN